MKGATAESKYFSKVLAASCALEHLDYSSSIKNDCIHIQLLHCLAGASDKHFIRSALVPRRCPICDNGVGHGYFSNLKKY